MTARSQERKRRVEERSRARRAASRIEVPATAAVGVIGGGASGLAAALAAAARLEPGAVVVLDAALEAGQTILVTGNGSCNLANVDLSPAHYNDPAFVGAVLGAHPAEAIADFFGELGLAIEEERAGRLYPRSRQAASVRNLLLEAAGRLGVVVAPLRRALAVEGRGDEERGGGPRWLITYDDRSGPRRTGTAELPPPRTLAVSAAVLAPGGGASPLAEALHLPQVPTRPALCTLACEPSPLDGLDGRRARAVVRLTRLGDEVARAAGEVLFRPAALTGPPLLDLSRLARAGDELAIDLVPERSHDEVVRAVAAHCDPQGSPGPHGLDGLIDPVIGRTIVELARRGWPLPADSIVESAAGLAKALPFTVTGRVADHAQVTQGGIATGCIDPRTMAVVRDASGGALPGGLFATGEVLDVDGPCGGYNLAFAWLSGLRAGRAAAELVRP